MKENRKLQLEDLHRPLLQPYLNAKINLNPNSRWERGVEHHPKASELMNHLMALDFECNNDFFCWKRGGDGDNGEALLFLLDMFFELQEVEAEAGIEYDARGGAEDAVEMIAEEFYSPAGTVFESVVMDWIPCDLPRLQTKLLAAGIDLDCGAIHERLLALKAAKGDIDVVDDGAGIFCWPQERELPIAAVEDGPSSGVYKWTVSIEVAPIWVADGFILTADRLHRMVLSELRRAHSSEVEVSILERPDGLQIAAEQGARGPRDAKTGKPINKPTYRPLLCDTCECYPCNCREGSGG
jgi:hypothetical protein